MALCVTFYLLIIITVHYDNTCEYYNEYWHFFTNVCNKIPMVYVNEWKYFTELCLEKNENSSTYHTYLNGWIPVGVISIYFLRQSHRTMFVDEMTLKQRINSKASVFGRDFVYSFYPRIHDPFCEYKV